VLLTHLWVGQHATVLQLPAQATGKLRRKPAPSLLRRLRIERSPPNTSPRRGKGRMGDAFWCCNRAANRAFARPFAWRVSALIRCRCLRVSRHVNTGLIQPRIPNYQVIEKRHEVVGRRLRGSRCSRSLPRRRSEDRAAPCTTGLSPFGLGRDLPSLDGEPGSARADWCARLDEVSIHFGDGPRSRRSLFIARPESLSPPPPGFIHFQNAGDCSAGRRC